MISSKLFKAAIVAVALSLAHIAVHADSAITGLPERMEDINGQTLSLFTSTQQVRLLFLDALCPMPHFPNCEQNLQTIREKLKHNSDHTYLVYNSFYVTAETAAGFSRRHQLDIPAVFDKKQTLFDHFEVYSTPYLIILDKEGNIEYRGHDFSHL